MVRFCRAEEWEQLLAINSFPAPPGSMKGVRWGQPELYGGRSEGLSHRVAKLSPFLFKTQLK